MYKRQVEGNRVTLNTALGHFAIPVESVPVNVGAAASIVIAADMVQIAREPSNAGNTVAATLISEEFVGSIVTLFLEAADGTEFKVQLQERALAELDIHAGGEFHLSWATDDAHLLSEGSE